MHAPDVKLENLGTEFALNVTARDSAVHVFEGEVIVHTKDKATAGLKVGMSLGFTPAGVSQEDFLPISELQGLIRQREQPRFQRWQTRSEGVSKNPRLIAYWNFRHAPDDRRDRLVSNFADPQHKIRAGGSVGAQWTQGPWPGKEALEFKRPGDRVRMSLDGTYAALILAS